MRQILLRVKQGMTKLPERRELLLQARRLAAKLPETEVLRRALDKKIQEVDDLIEAQKDNPNSIYARQDSASLAAATEARKEIERLAGISPAHGVLLKRVLWSFEFPDVFAISQRTLMLYGPSGTGKSYLAKQLALALGFEYLEWELGNIFHANFGQSEKVVPEFERSLRGMRRVVFVDEIDSIASVRSKRDDGTAAVVQRIMALFWQMLDHVCEQDDFRHVCVVVATNVPQELDPRFFRRFRVRLAVELPSDEVKLHMLQRFLGPGLEAEEALSTEVLRGIVQSCTQGMSVSDLQDCAMMVQGETAEVAVSSALAAGETPRPLPITAEHLARVLRDAPRANSAETVRALREFAAGDQKLSVLDARLSDRPAAPAAAGGEEDGAAGGDEEEEGFVAAFSE